jgi:hypothetical protein
MQKKNDDESSHSYDKSGNSLVYNTWFKLDNGRASIHCEDWSKKLEEKNNWSDKLKVSLYSDKFFNFLQNEAYK